MARLGIILIVVLQVITVLADPVLVEEPVEEVKTEETPVVAESRSFDTMEWKGVPYAVDPQPPLPDVEEPWPMEDAPQEQPPRKRRPGRRRKKRPQHPQPTELAELTFSDNPEHEGGVIYNFEGVVSAAFAEEDQAPQQRRPQRLPSEQSTDQERPHRKRGHKRRQRPYLPNIETGPTALAGETQTPNKENQEDYKIAPYIEEINHELRGELKKGQSEIEKLPSAEGSSSIKVEAPIEYKSNAEKHVNALKIHKANDNNNALKNDKSYRRPYSQAKKQETEEASMVGASADLKALLKQSGGLSLSEVLQQRNLSLSDLLTGKQHAITALKTNGPVALNAIQAVISNKEILNEDISENSASNKNLQENNEDEEQKPLKRLPVVSSKTHGKLERERLSISGTEENSKRRLPPVTRRNRIQNKKENLEAEIRETTTIPNIYAPSKIRKPLHENIIRRRPEEQEIDDTTEEPTDFKELLESTEPITTTEYPTTTYMTTTKKTTDDNRNRLSLKPRLRLPAVKTVPRRISNPEIKTKPEIEKLHRPKLTRPEIKSKEEATTTPKAKIPAKAFQINIKDIFGMQDMMSEIKPISKEKSEPVMKQEPISSVKMAVNSYRPITRAPAIFSTTTKKPEIKTTKVPSAKEEILEVLTDIREGERLTKVLAERNMTLKELVEHRERGSSQVHLADIFYNSSKDSKLPEPFLAKSLIEPISKQTYPLKALLDGNFRERDKATEAIKTITTSPAPFIDYSKTSHSEENLGIVTLFDKFSEFAGQPKIFDPKDIKKDSDGSSYITSVISVKPTDEIYRESRGGFQNSHKQVSEIYSSIPTYINTDEIIDARVIQDWSKIPHRQSILIPVHNGIDNRNAHIDRDIDGDGLIVLDDLQKNDEFNVAEAANLGYQEPSEDRDYDQERSFYQKIPVGMRSAIVLSSAIVGTSLIVFLTIFMACRWRQKRRNLLRYDDSFNGSRVRSPILNGRKVSKNNSSSRSISPILLNGETIYKSQSNQKVNTMDSQTQREAQEYLWDSLRKPFQ